MPLLLQIRGILHEFSGFIEFIKQFRKKEIKFETCRAFYHFSATSLIERLLMGCNKSNQSKQSNKFNKFNNT